MNVKNVFLWCGCVALLFVGCATKGGLSVPSERGVVESAAAMDGLRFVQRVSDNAVYSKNIVSKIDFSINTGSKNISVGGSIHMRKDEVIRIYALFALPFISRLLKHDTWRRLFILII